MSYTQLNAKQRAEYHAYIDARRVNDSLARAKFEDGLDEGMEKGIQIGKQKGRKEGIEEGIAKALERLIDSGMSEQEVKRILKVQ